MKRIKKNCIMDENDPLSKLNKIPLGHRLHKNQLQS